MDNIAALLALDPGTIARVTELHHRGEITLLGVSGKLASGKDTVAAAAMGALGHPDATHRYYAEGIKDEVDQVVAEIAERGPSAGMRISDEQGVHLADAEHMVALLAPELAADPALHARKRTPEMRTALQYWGTEVRRAQDPDYWVKLAVRGALSVAATGRSIHFTDLRFPNEVEWLRKVGFFTVRIDVTPETQAARLAARDGLPPEPSALIHASECALDGHAGFDLRVSNDGAIDTTVAAITAGLTTWRSGHALVA